MNTYNRHRFPPAIHRQFPGALSKYSSQAESKRAGLIAYPGGIQIIRDRAFIEPPRNSRADNIISPEKVWGPWGAKLETAVTPVGPDVLDGCDVVNGIWAGGRRDGPPVDPGQAVISPFFLQVSMLKGETNSRIQGDALLVLARGRSALRLRAPCDWPLFHMARNFHP